jgi:hypothetical protein
MFHNILTFLSYNNILQIMNVNKKIYQILHNLILTNLYINDNIDAKFINMAKDVQNNAYNL